MGLLNNLLGGAGAYVGLRMYLSTVKLPLETTYPFEEFCMAKGYNVQNHWVATKDGYYLRLFRLSKSPESTPGKSPVLMVHGMTDNAKGFCINQSAKPAAFELVDQGHDVWLLNCRGNIYSRIHKTLNYTQPEFWNWCATHIGDFDVPASIDYVLQKTGKQKLNYIGHSQGSYAGLHCFAANPEYGDKVNLAALWSAPCGMISLNTTRFLYLLKAAAYGEVQGPVGINAPMTAIKFAAAFPQITSKISQYVAAIKPEEELPKALPAYIYNFAGKTSLMNYKFWKQMVDRKSPIPSYFDYGEKKNMEVYGAKVPNTLNFDNIRCNLAMFHGKYDQIVSKTDFDVLRMQIPKSKIAFYKNDYEIDHLGFLTSKNQSHMNDLLKLLK